MSWEHWDTDKIPGLAQWVKDPGLLQLQLGSDPWPGNSMCHRAAKKRKNYLCPIVILGLDAIRTDYVLLVKLPRGGGCLLWRLQTRIGSSVLNC